MTRLFAVQMARRTVLCCAALLLAWMVAYQLNVGLGFESDLMRWGAFVFLMLPCLAIGLLGGWLLIFAERPLIRITGGTVVGAAMAFSIFVMLTYAGGYRFCHIERGGVWDMVGGRGRSYVRARWYVPYEGLPFHCHRPGEAVEDEFWDRLFQGQSMPAGPSAPNYSHWLTYTEEGE